MAEEHERVAAFFQKGRRTLEGPLADPEKHFYHVGGVVGLGGTGLDVIRGWLCEAIGLSAGPTLSPVSEETWKLGLKAAMETAAARQQVARRLQKLEQDVAELKRQLTQRWSLAVQVTTLAPEPFELLKEIPVVIQPSEDEYVASFFDANINASGSTETEAVANVKDLLVAIFRRLSEMPPDRLGPGPTRQLAVLKGFIRHRPEHG